MHLIPGEKSNRPSLNAHYMRHGGRSLGTYRRLRGEQKTLPHLHRTNVSLQCFYEPSEPQGQAEELGLDTGWKGARNCLDEERRGRGIDRESLGITRSL